MNRILSKEVSFELAKLLKEKGYDELCYGYYHYTSFLVERSSVLCCNSRIADSCYTAPTIAEVLDWIYDKIGNWFSIDSENNKTYYYYVPKEGEINFSKEYPTILEAYEKAIEYSLRNFNKKI